ncbi:hypothetical protein BRV77_002866, partial [Escherichia coli]|nr:hypothetical protein [Escherichia coli]
AVNSQTRTLTLDREITLPSSGTTLISLVDGSGNPRRSLRNGSRIVRQFGGVISIIGVCFKR